MIVITKNIKWLIFLSVITILWLILIFIESSLPPPKILGEMPGLDKVAHFVVYSILGVLIMAILTTVLPKKILVLPLVAFLVFIAGLFDEFHQSYVPDRSVDAWDLFADFCGGLIPTTLIFFVKTKDTPPTSSL
jgi:hypothetical protein